MLFVSVVIHFHCHISSFQVFCILTYLSSLGGSLPCLLCHPNWLSHQAALRSSYEYVFVEASAYMAVQCTCPAAHWHEMELCIVRYLPLNETKWLCCWQKWLQSSKHRCVWLGRKDQLVILSMVPYVIYSSRVHCWIVCRFSNSCLVTCYSSVIASLRINLIQTLQLILDSATLEPASVAFLYQFSTWIICFTIKSWRLARHA